MKRIRIARQTILGREVMIVTKGNIMGKRGPKRKEGLREPNGRLDRRTASQRWSDAVTRDRREALSVAVSNPDRRHAKNPEDYMLHHALGRVCRYIGASEGTYEGVCEYAAVREKIRMAKAGGPQSVGKRSSYGDGNPDGPMPETIARWESRRDQSHRAVISLRDKMGINHKGPSGTQLCCIIYNLSVHGIEPPRHELDAMAVTLRSAMGEIAVAMGTLPGNPHPFK